MCITLRRKCYRLVLKGFGILYLKVGGGLVKHDNKSPPIDYITKIKQKVKRKKPNNEIRVLIKERSRPVLFMRQ